MVEIGADGKSVKYASETEDAKPDVSVNITSSDLAGVLKVSFTFQICIAIFTLFKFSGKSSSTTGLFNRTNLHLRRHEKTYAL